jgi:ferrous iron transport protein A
LETGVLNPPSVMLSDVDTAESGRVDAAAAAGVEGVALNQMPRGVATRVLRVEAVGAIDPIADRLRELGFVAGEPVKIVAAGPLGGEPLLVQVGFTRFALRKAEAARVKVVCETAR